MKPRLLFADSDSSMLDLYQRFFSGCFGYPIEIAADGLDCMRKLRQRVPDVLIAERHLPWGGSDGIIAIMCEEYRVLPFSVVLVDNEDAERWCDNALDTPQERLLGAPVVACFYKPFRMHELLQCICAVSAVDQFSTEAIKSSNTKPIESHVPFATRQSRLQEQ